MLESSGSILQLQSRATKLSNVHLLIVSPHPASFQAIATSLSAAGVTFSADTVEPQQLEENSSHSQYCALIHDYRQTSANTTIDSLINNLQWWGHLYPEIPVVLVTDVLGDEQAIRLMQSGVSGYVLRHKLHQLPEILEKSLFDFAAKQAIAQQQQNLIQQQQAQIQQLETEKQTWLEQQQLRQEHIAHLVHE